MTRRILLTLPALLALLVVMGFGLRPAPSEATEYSTKAPIDVAQATTAQPGASGSGTGLISYNTSTNLLSWDITFGGTQQPVTLMHFHGPAAPGVGGGIQVTISDIISPSVGSATINAGQESDLLDGLWYINIHTSHSPGGEIRGQVTNVAGDTIGGIAELPAESAAPLDAAASSSGNGGSVLLITALIGALVVVLASGAWYVGRRALR